MVLSLDFDGEMEDLFEIIRKLFTGLPLGDQVTMATSMLKHATGELLKRTSGLEKTNLPTTVPASGGLPN